MAFDLDVPLRNCSLVTRCQRFSKTHVLGVVPETEVVVQHVVTRSRALRLGGISEHVVGTPNTLRRLQVRLTDARDVVE